jgi:streptogramin lyase
MPVVLLAAVAAMAGLMSAGAAAVAAPAQAGQVTIFGARVILNPEWITTGPDGAMWFTLAYTSGIGRITTTETP